MQKGEQTPGKVSAAGFKGTHGYRKEETSEDAERDREGEEPPLEVHVHAHQVPLPWPTHPQPQEVYQT